MEKQQVSRCRGGPPGQFGAVPAVGLWVAFYLARQISAAGRAEPVLKVVVETTGEASRLRPQTLSAVIARKQADAEHAAAQGTTHATALSHGN